VTGAGDWTANVYFSQHSATPVYLRSFAVASDGSWGGRILIPGTAVLGLATLTAMCFDATHHVPSTTNVYYLPLYLGIVPVHRFAVDRSAASPGTPIRVTSTDPCPAPADAPQWYYAVAVRNPETGEINSLVSDAPNADGNWTTSVWSTDAASSEQAQIAAGCGDGDPTGGSTHLDYYVPVTITALPSPSVSLSTNLLAFGRQRLGTVSDARTVTLTNPSSGTLTFGQATTVGTNRADFHITTDTCSRVTVDPGGSCHVTISFRPSGDGNRTATLAFTDNAATSPQVVSLTGRGCALVLGGVCV
jgi:hypothetical protein